MLRITPHLLRQRRKGFGISPFAMFLIRNKGNVGVAHAQVRYASLTEVDKLTLVSLAARHPSFTKSRLQKFYTFIRQRFHKLDGSAAKRMKKIGKEWQAIKHRF